MEDAVRPTLPARRSLRLEGFDYASDAGYVVTICSHHRRPLFDSVRDCTVVLSLLGRIVREEWLRTPEMRPAVLLDEFIIMPNHLHGILILNNSHGGRRGAVGASGPGRTLSAIIRGFKSACSARVRRERLPIALPIWQIGFFDRIIRDDEELQKFRRYIASNPEQWELDRHFRR
jgi:REP element-mobilizing transposase RayT